MFEPYHVKLIFSMSLIHSYAVSHIIHKCLLRSFSFGHILTYDIYYLNYLSPSQSYFRMCSGKSFAQYNETFLVWSRNPDTSKFTNLGAIFLCKQCSRCCSYENIKVHLIFSGGSAAKFLCNGLPSLETDWSKWLVFFCDERHVPLTDGECTYKFYKENLMSKVPLSEDNVFPDNPDLSGEYSMEQHFEMFL